MSIAEKGALMTDLCGGERANPVLPAQVHRCVIRVGWHVVHACHCGLTWRVGDEEQVDNVRRAARSAALDRGAP